MGSCFRCKTTHQLGLGMLYNRLRHQDTAPPLHELSHPHYRTLASSPYCIARCSKCVLLTDTKRRVRPYLLNAKEPDLIKRFPKRGRDILTFRLVWVKLQKPSHLWLGHPSRFIQLHVPSLLKLVVCTHVMSFEKKILWTASTGSALPYWTLTFYILLNIEYLGFFFKLVKRNTLMPFWSMYSGHYSPQCNSPSQTSSESSLWAQGYLNQWSLLGEAFSSPSWPQSITRSTGVK